jgi:hypothetical protein
MPRAQAGVASALASTSRQVGATLGIAMSGSIVGIAADDPRFATATRPFWWLVVAGGIVVVVLGFVATSRWARRTAESVRELVADA